MCARLSFDKRIEMYYEEYDNYLLEIIKETIPRQLVNLKKYNLLQNESLRQYVGSITDVFNFQFEFEDIRDDVERILKEKYNYIIKSDEPLIMEKYKND